MRNILVYLGAAICLWTSAALNAAPITITAEGVTSGFFDPDSLLPFADPGLGSPWRLSFTYDSSTAGRRGASATTLEGYPNAILDFEMNVAGQSFSLLDEGVIVILNTGVVDVWQAVTLGLSPLGPPNPDTGTQERFLRTLIGITFQDTVTAGQPLDVLSDVSLVAPPPLEEWESARFTFLITELDERNGQSIQTDLAEATATVTSVNVVPVPAAAWLFGSAIFGLGWLRRGVTRP